MRAKSCQPVGHDEGKDMVIGEVGRAVGNPELLSWLSRINMILAKSKGQNSIVQLTSQQDHDFFFILADCTCILRNPRYRLRPALPPPVTLRKHFQGRNYPDI